MEKEKVSNDKNNVNCDNKRDIDYEYMEDVWSPIDLPCDDESIILVGNCRTCTVDPKDGEIDHGVPEMSNYFLGLKLPEGVLIYSFYSPFDDHTSTKLSYGSYLSIDFLYEETLDLKNKGSILLDLASCKCSKFDPEAFPGWAKRPEEGRVSYSKHIGYMDIGASGKKLIDIHVFSKEPSGHILFICFYVSHYHFGRFLNFLEFSKSLRKQGLKIKYASSVSCEEIKI